MKIEENKDYRIRGESKYFKKKYGTSNPIITIEAEHTKVFRGWWGMQIGNPACMVYGVRFACEGLPSDSFGSDEVFYGKIRGLGELVHISELEEVGEKIGGNNV